MKSLLCLGIFASVLLLTGCGKDEPKAEPENLPSADKMFDKSKAPQVAPGAGKQDKGTAG